MSTMGRPTKYTKELLDAAREYLETYTEDGSPVPSVVGLALHIGIDKSTCYDWANHEDKREFSDILKRVSMMQEQKLISGGLGGDFNPAFAKMMMTKHGYSDKVEQDVKSSDGSMTPKAVPMTFTINGVEPDEQSND